MRVPETARLFIPLALGLSALLFVFYVTEQQELREGANDPQQGMAEDLAALIADDATTPVPAAPAVPIQSSLSPYVVAYDAFGNPVAGTGYLAGTLPHIPSGIFDVARSKGEDTLTWQPEQGVRQAITVVAISNGAGGFVMGGRSLRSVEREETLLGERSLAGLAFVLLAALLGSYLAARFKK